ncbi:hypothetical protein [Paenibacillus sp. YPG26]|nr:hypothetical protein [Paenibacillus sp. YPG26]
MIPDTQQELPTIELYLEPEEESEYPLTEPLKTVDDVLAYYANRK